MYGRSVMLVMVLAALPARLPAQCESGSFDSTFALIQKAIFENRGCTSDACHGSPTPAASICAPTSPTTTWSTSPAQTPPRRAGTASSPARDAQPAVPERRRQDAARRSATAPLRADAARSAAGADAPTSSRRCACGSRAARRATATVAGTGELLDACLPPPEPIEIEPLPPPRRARACSSTCRAGCCAPHSEHEVCFATYYDVTDQVPAAVPRPGRAPSATSARRSARIRSAIT